MKLLVAAVFALSVFVNITLGNPLFSFVKPSPHIVGGDEAEPHSFPYQVGLKVYRSMYESHFCGGALISDRWVLTAAHCLRQVHDIVVLLGAHKIKDPEPSVQILADAEIHIYPGWTSEIDNNDIALIKLNQTVDLTGKNVGIIRLPKESQKSELFQNAEIVISGWGQERNYIRRLSPVLRYVTTRVEDNAKCRKMFKTVASDSNICSSGRGFKGGCHGDSGGPMVTTENDGEKTLLGVYSYGSEINCEFGYPSVFTRVTSYLDWIHTTTGIPIRP